MTKAQTELLKSLQSFDIDGGKAAFSFAKRLSRENGWTLDFAKQVIEEYWKFVFLAMEAGHPVTPSDEVDQAWHLHLLYSQSYEQMNRLLPRPLHHGPTKGGKAEIEKFEDWYGRTLNSYRIYFGEPPADIWPDSNIRFARAPHFQRVNTLENWIISKARVKRWALNSLGLSIVPMLAGCTYWAVGAGTAQIVSTQTGVIIIVVLALILIGTVVFAISRSYPNAGRGTGSHTGSGCGATSGCGSSSRTGDYDSSGSDGASDGGSGCGGGGCGGGGCGSS